LPPSGIKLVFLRFRGHSLVTTPTETQTVQSETDYI